MAVSPAIYTIGLKALRRDLIAMVPDAGVEIRTLIKHAIQPMVAIARRNAPGSGTTIGGPWKATTSGATGRLTNTHPGAAPWEFGGTIQPKGAPIVLAPPAHMVWGPGGALEEGKADVERGLIVGFERMARRHGWH